MPSKVCYEFEASRTCSYGAKCKFSHTAVAPIPRASIAMQVRCLQLSEPWEDLSTFFPADRRDTNDKKQVLEGIF
jgi:hypothetical protein